MRNYSFDGVTKYYNDVLGYSADLPFSYTYNGEKHCGLPARELLVKSEDLSSEKSLSKKLTYQIDKDIYAEYLITHYTSHGAIEWTVSFENLSDGDSGVFEALESNLTLNGDYPCLKGILGDHVNSYSPYSYDLTNSRVTFSSDSGRATHINFPYFNLEYGKGGLLIAIGWAGTWSLDAESENGVTSLRMSAVNNLKTYLKKGEKIRSALFTIVPYTIRSEHYATNLWRDFYVKHNLPKSSSKGDDLFPFSCCCLSGDTGYPNSDGSISERSTTWRPSLEKMIAEDAKVNFRWFDAGWYVAPDLRSPEPFVPGRDWWDTDGTWELDPVKWPDKTFLESTEFARENGMKTLMWFEPERVTDPDNLAKNFGYKKEWAIKREGIHAISNNIGDPECLKWTTERVCKVLRENKVEMYREDNNCDAAGLWKQLDSIEGENRCGITESKFIIGHYKMWDDIIACTLSIGGCGFVDSCASGGGRNDLESMRRGIPLLRSDADRTSTALRLSITTAFNKWIPFCGANTKEKAEELSPKGKSDPYVWRASYLAALNVASQFVQDPNQDFDILRFGLKEWKKVNPYLLKEFYTLTPWHSRFDNTDFTAFSYYDPDTEKGVILAFRQEHCELDTLKIKLPYASNNDKFILTDEDTKETTELFGANITLHFDSPRSAKLIFIEKV